MATSDSPLSVPNVTLAVARAAQAAVSGLTLAASNYVPRKLDMLPVYPVSSAETDRQPTSAALFKNARPGLKYEVPIVVGFGAYPFNARKIAGPSWLTVNSDLKLVNGVYEEPDDYLTITGTPPTGSEGIYTVTVGVTDQDYGRATNPSSELQISYTLTVSSNAHVFVAPTATGSGDGSSPENCAAYTELHAGATTISLGKDKIAVWRGGNYTNPFVDLDSAYHAMSHVAYPSETPDLDLNGGGFEFSSPDLIFVGFTIRNGFNKAIQNRSLSGNNSGFWRCSFTGFTRDTTITNQSIWFTTISETVYRTRMFMRECNLSQMGDISAYIWYSTDNTVIERNTAGQPSGAVERSVLFPKQNNTRHCIRRNTIDYSSEPSLSSIGLIQVYNSEKPGDSVVPLSDETEVCYNLVLTGGTDCIEFNRSSVAQTDKSWSYRNTYVDGKFWVYNWLADAREVTVENDVIQNAAGGVTAEGTGADGTILINSEAHGTSGVVGVSGKLDGTFRTTYLGKRGYEIAGEES